MNRKTFVVWVPEDSQLNLFQLFSLVAEATEPGSSMHTLTFPGPHSIEHVRLQIQVEEIVK